MVKTKIICTLGPASDSRPALRKMMRFGMDVARLNFSHGTPASHESKINLIRGLNRTYRRHIRILQDLEGYRIRIGKFKRKGGIALKKRKNILLTNKLVLGNQSVIPFDYEGSLLDIRKGTHIFIDDGNICLLVKEAKKSLLKAEVIVPGIVKENKGVNIPDVNLKFKGMTDKDRRDIEFGIRHKVDYIAQSFVRNAEDILRVKRIVKKRHPKCLFIAKIENRSGIKNIDQILSVSDGIMVARGDMGVSLPIYEIPVIQKAIIKKCNKKGKFVITATQMLESMTEHIRPTRAEVTDVANAVIDGTDFVMLSGETASGRYPAETVHMMNQILKYTEAHL